MATLDPRLLPFIDMLAELGIDWLAFELFDGIQRGEEQLEDEEALALARQPIGTHDPEEDTDDRPTDDEAMPTKGDDQLEWVARYVYERLDATLAAVSGSLDALDEIVADRGEPAHSAGDSHATTILMLLDDGEAIVVGRTQVESAQAQLPKLRNALDTWLDNARTDSVR